jgi:shikimate dehydrogenase
VPSVDPAEALRRAISLHGNADRSRDARSVLVGLVGRGIQSSRSPVMHEREAERLGLRCDYVLVDFDQLGLPDHMIGEVIGAAERAGFAGLNVTHPYKQRVIGCLGGLAPEAEAIGAVNTVILRGGERVGHNTDSWGFAESFRDTMGGGRLDAVVQFGAGGAGAAVAHALLALGVGTLFLVDTDIERARALAERMNSRFGARTQAVEPSAVPLDSCDGIVNTTPVGMEKYPGTPFPIGLLRPHHWVAEIVYFPQETELLRAARALGCRTQAGTGMAIYQAVRAFELFTGMEPDRREMSRHFGAAA